MKKSIICTDIASCAEKVGLQISASSPLLINRLKGYCGYVAGAEKLFRLLMLFDVLLL